MNLRRSLPLLLAGVLGALLGTSFTATAVPTHAAAYTECAFAQATWHPDHAPPSVPGGFVGLTAIPAGWTLINGSMGQFFCGPGLPVARST
jgi:hypothetical protein